MGLIKLSKKSVAFFKDNQDKIFKTGKLAEGPWNDQLSKKIWGMDRFRVQSLQKILSQENLRSGDRTATIQMLKKKCEILIKGFRNRGNIKEISVYQNIANKYLNI